MFYGIGMNRCDVKLYKSACLILVCISEQIKTVTLSMRDYLDGEGPTEREFSFFVGRNPSLLEEQANGALSSVKNYN